MSPHLTIDIIIPLISIDADIQRLVQSLSSINTITAPPVKIIFVINSKALTSIEFRQFVSPFLKKSVYNILHYTESRGPSQAWCYGVKKSNANYIWLIAKDSFLPTNWPETLAQTTQNQYTFTIGKYYLTQDTTIFARSEKLIDFDRFNRNTVDFRNFLVNREALMDIINRYFNNLYCSDVELDIVLKRNGIKVERSELSILNIYPNNLKDFFSRKYKHGISFGRIAKMVLLANNNKLTKLVWPFTFFYKPKAFVVKSKVNLIEFFTIFMANFIFLIGLFYGYYLPKKLVNKYYIHYFDEPTKIFPHD